MKNKLLLPNNYKRYGIGLLIPFAVIGVLSIYNEFELGFLQTGKNIPYFNMFDFTDNNFTNEIALSGVMIGLLMIAFSKEKTEDEFIHQIRLESWQWAVIINYALLFLANWLIYGSEFLQVMIYNMLTILIIFIIRFNWLLYKYKKQLSE
ncbi:MAG: hypothetical protein GC171_05445 [Terrimonas sp.]|nr:hypothetical protein [Terrimonas sp.]